MKKNILYTLLIVLSLTTIGCAGKIPSDEIRIKLYNNDADSLIEKIKKDKNHESDMMSSLNLSRLYQLKEDWRESIKYYEIAIANLEEYESRAIINLREIASDVGTSVISKGLEQYYGEGYERSLIHTFNSLNYVMLNDLEAAAVELRKMEYRQELWLEELALKNKILNNFESSEANTDSSDTKQSQSAPKKVEFFGHQEPFSYVLSAYINAAIGNMEYANISQKRASALSPEAENLFKKYPLKTFASNIKNKKKTKIPTIIVAVTGLTSPRHMAYYEQSVPMVGTIVIDVPSYKPPLANALPNFYYSNNKIEPSSLLSTDVLTATTLKNNIDNDIKESIARNVIRSAAIAGTGIALHSNKKTRDYALPAMILLDTIFDLASRNLDDYVRNWETLPHEGYITVEDLPINDVLTIDFYGSTESIDIPTDAKMIFVFVSAITSNLNKVNYAIFK